MCILTESLAYTLGSRPPVGLIMWVLSIILICSGIVILYSKETDYTQTILIAKCRQPMYNMWHTPVHMTDCLHPTRIHRNSFFDLISLWSCTLLSNPSTNTFIRTSLYSNYYCLNMHATPPPDTRYLPTFPSSIRSVVSLSPTEHISEQKPGS